MGCYGWKHAFTDSLTAFKITKSDMLSCRWPSKSSDKIEMSEKGDHRKAQGIRRSIMTLHSFMR
jgi:hypothetical protein